MRSLRAGSQAVLMLSAMQRVANTNLRTTRHLFHGGIGDALFGFAQPRGHQPQTENDENYAGGNPHDEPAELLIFHGREMERGGATVVDRIPKILGEGHQCAENAGVDGGGEHVKNAHAVTEASVATVDERPPEEQRGEEKGGVLECMNPVVLDAGIVERRDMPGPERRSMEQPDEKRERHHAPERGDLPLLRKPATSLSPADGQCPYKPDER